MSEHPDLDARPIANACLEYKTERGRNRIIRCEPEFVSYVMDMKDRCAKHADLAKEIRELRDTVALYAETLGLDGHASTVDVLRGMCDLVTELRGRVLENTHALSDAAAGLNEAKSQQQRLSEGFADAREGLRELEQQIDAFRVDIRRREGSMDQLCADHALGVHNAKAVASLAAAKDDLALRQLWAAKFNDFAEVLQRVPIESLEHTHAITRARALSNELYAEVGRAERRLRNWTCVTEGDEDPDDD